MSAPKTPSSFEALYFANPHAQFEAHKDEIMGTISEVLNSSTYILGPHHATFESLFAEFLQAEHVLGVANGTDALVIALAAVGVGHGDQVLVPSHTAPPTISAIRQVGAEPRFLDVDPDTYVITPEIVRKAITSKTKALIVVHIYGFIQNCQELRQLADSHGIKLIEDCAQAAGAAENGKRAGTFGHASTFSFFPTKNLGAVGDAGAVATNDADTAEHVRKLRTFGWNEDRVSVTDGFNSRLDEVQAAILCVKLKYLDADNRNRQKIAKRYDAAFDHAALKRPFSNSNGNHVYHLYTLQVANRTQFLDRMAEVNVHCGIHYAKPTHLHPAFARFCTESLPITEAICQNTVSLPIYPELSDDKVDRVIAAVLSSVAP